MDPDIKWDSYCLYLIDVLLHHLAGILKPQWINDFIFRKKKIPNVIQRVSDSFTHIPES